MKIYNLKRQQVIPIGLSEAWNFFSSPENLKEITPGYMNFRILSELPEIMYPGMIIKYRVSPVSNISVNWVTEITQLKAPDYFIDEQRFGPYKFWHHQHHFKPHTFGTEIIDIVNYGLPFGVVGRLGHWLYVEKQLNSIFEYRSNTLKKLFGKTYGHQTSTI